MKNIAYAQYLLGMYVAKPRSKTSSKTEKKGEFAGDISFCLVDGQILYEVKFLSSIEMRICCPSLASWLSTAEIPHAFSANEFTKNPL